GSSQNNIDDKGYWDSGCSRHLTGSISCLSDYEPVDRGYVSFGQGGCKITGKGTIKTECIVLGRNFKLSDDDNVLLRTPRQHNMCDNGGEFRNKEMNDFCSHKGIKREFSNARTPQQNGVAERRNSTLIEAARTMLVDAKLPVTFWAEAVNTACYVQSRPSSNTRLVLKRVANQVETPSLDNILILTNRFEDILGVTTNSDESNGVEADNVWTLVDCPKGVRPIGIKWVLKNKKDERGIVIRNKSKLVAQGHTQDEGIDYDEVFTPVEGIEAIRLFLAYDSFMWFTVYQMDVKSAFLYGTIDEEVYVMQPPRFQDLEFPARVYKVEKAMYGLHQAPRAWYGTLSKYLLTNDFQKGTIDQTLFIRRQKGDFILVQVYMDDIIFRSSNLQLCREFEALM
nr:copia protein [Tanacetum cinerariifolium]